MKPSEIGKAYDQITHRWQSAEFNRQNGIKQHEKALAFVHNKGRALDVGCGCTGRFIDLLIQAGFEPEGVDVSENMIQLAREKHPEIPFYLADICEWNLPGQYDFITAWDSIWHIPLQQQEPVITKLISGLNSGGVLIFSFGGIDSPGDHRNDVMGPEVYYSSLGTQAVLKLLLQLPCTVRHLEYDEYPEMHTFLIVQKS